MDGKSEKYIKPIFESMMRSSKVGGFRSRSHDRR